MGFADVFNVRRCEQLIRVRIEGQFMMDVVELKGSIIMPMDVSAIQPGKCYVTSSKEKFTVVDINRGIVTYKSWTTDAKKLSLRINTGVKAFAAAVVKEITCPPAE
jgi:hypothetical protein